MKRRTLKQSCSPLIIMGYTVRVSDPRCKFSAAHFLYQHDKCSRLHGHNYSVNVEVSGDLNEHFFVVDFYILKQKLIEITSQLDHAVLIPAHSAEIHVEEQRTESGSQVQIKFNEKTYIFPKVDVRLLPIPATTAEVLAKYIYDQLCVVFTSYTLQVEVAESEGSIARYSP
ncbi:6-pyruvoyl tetrahydropterin synthase family protein [Candidatus Lokiarchaeum ossiferum]|uniref:6-pyruvoyl tetrahydropterin synthase family protein n=1 Tax=Candidatus Lokiarchaeum ossiferum TaxID=2951803 RepID=UPI00352E8FC0